MSGTVVRRIGSPLGQRLPSEPIIVKKRFLTPLLLRFMACDEDQDRCTRPSEGRPSPLFYRCGRSSLSALRWTAGPSPAATAGVVCRRLDHHIGAVDGEVTVRLDCLSCSGDRVFMNASGAGLYRAAEAVKPNCGHATCTRPPSTAVERQCRSPRDWKNWGPDLAERGWRSRGCFTSTKPDGRP